jgi:hypothetical protein
MPNTQRKAVVAMAFADGDREVIGAFVGFHRLQTGCYPATIAALHEAYQERVAPVEFARLQEH